MAMKSSDFTDGDISQSNRVSSSNFLNPVLKAVRDVIGNGTDGPTTAAEALTNLGGGTTGKLVFAAATAAAVRSIIGALQDVAGVITTAYLGAAAVTLPKVDSSVFPFAVGMVNGTIVASRSGNAETISIKTKAGTDPSSTDPVHFYFRNATAGTGDYTIVSATAALSVTISSGSTVGATNSTPFRLWLVVFNDASTLRLGVVNCLSGTDIMYLREDGTFSSTAEGGAGGADSAQVIYTDAAVSSKALCIIGYLNYTLAAVGTWGTAPTKIQIRNTTTPLPGATLQQKSAVVSALVSCTTGLPCDDTIPQNTEGDQINSVAITPSDSANVLRVSSIVAANTSSGSGGYQAGMAMFRDSTANAVAATWTRDPFYTGTFPPIDYEVLAGSVSATTFAARVGSNAGSTTVYINGSGGVRLFGGVMRTVMRAEEIMA